MTVKSRNIGAEISVDLLIEQSLCYINVRDAERKYVKDLEWKTMLVFARTSKDYDQAKIHDKLLSIIV